MNFETYSPLALRTCKVLSPAQALVHAQIGANTEVGELLDAFKRLAIYGKALDKINVTEEIGDLAFYVNIWLAEQAVKTSDVDVWLQNLDPSLGSFGGFWQLTGPIQMQDPFELAKAGNLLCLVVSHMTDPVAAVSAESIFKAIFSVLNAILQYLDLTLEDALDRNIQKLSKRFGDSFSEFAALNRDVAAERVVLES